MTHTTVGNLRKKAALVKKQPEADGESNRWRYKKNRQFRLLSEEMLQFESDLEELLDRAFSLGNLTLDTICRAANHLAGQHGVERKDSNGQVISFGRKWARSFAKRQKCSFVRTKGKKMKTWSMIIRSKNQVSKLVRNVQTMMIKTSSIRMKVRFV